MFSHEIILVRMMDMYIKWLGRIVLSSVVCTVSLNVC